MIFNDFPIAKILRQLEKNNLLPAIVFRSARRQCDDDLYYLNQKVYAQILKEDKEKIKERVDLFISKNSLDSEIFLNNPQYQTLVNYGAGAHHAGQLLPWRLMLEELMSEGMLRLLIATGTVAAGVDFPARSVVVTAHSKRGHDGFNHLTSSEFQQMSGRAGRRGKDAVGFCFAAPNPYCDARVISEIEKAPPEPLKSSYFASPSSVLNLLKYRSVEDLRFIVGKSLAAFMDGRLAAKMRERIPTEAEVEAKRDQVAPADLKKEFKRIRRKHREADQVANSQIENLERTLEALQKLGHVNEDMTLTEKGTWAAELCSSLVLELAEIVDAFLLDDCSTQELIGTVGSITGDSYRSYLKIKNTVVKKSKLEKVAGFIDKVKECYENPQLDPERKASADAAATVETWALAPDWKEFSALLNLSGVADGDASRLISQTADQLLQLSRLGDYFPDLAAQAMEARQLLLKPPISDLY